MELEIGNWYKKSNFRITKAEKQWSEITVGGELFTFFPVESKYKNIIEKDGFVYEGRGQYALIPDGKQSELRRNVFYKKVDGAEYEYLGKGKYERRYDEKHNKIFW